MLVSSSVTQADHDDDHAGDVEVAAFEVLVEPGPGAQIECRPFARRAERAIDPLREICWNSAW